MDTTSSKVTLKVHRKIYEAVPHLFDGEIVLVVCEPGHEPNAGQFLCKGEGGVKFYFIEKDPGGGEVASKFDGFKRNVQTYCQLEDIVCDPDGYVMDGYARWFADLRLGIEPRYTILGNLSDDDAKLTWARGRKLCRLNLTEAQRMAIVKAEIKSHVSRSNAWTAELLGVSRRTIIKYRQQLEQLGVENGGIPALKEVECKDGTKQKHEPFKPLTEQELKMEQENVKLKTAERERTKNGKVIQKFLSENKGLLLTPDRPDKTLQNIRKVFTETDLTNPALADDLRAVQEAIAKQQAEGWKPMKVGERNLDGAQSIVGALCEEYSHDSIQGIADYFCALVDAVARGHIDVDEQVDEALVNCTKAVIDQAEEFLKNLTREAPSQGRASVPVTAMASWDVQTLDMAKTKAGLSIKLRTDHAPDKVDIVDQVKPGPVSFGGKVIQFGDHALLLIPHEAQDAILTSEPPKEDDLLNAAK